MTEPINILDSYKHFKGLPGQVAAANYLQSILSDHQLEYFAGLYRKNPTPVKPWIKSDGVLLPNFPYLSQRDNPGNYDGDGTADKWQTCNVTSCAMVIQYLTGKRVSPTELDKQVRSKYGSRYVHSNLVKLMRDYGVRSEFDVSTTHAEIRECLKAGNPVIWSNKLTHGGHIAVIIGYSEDNNYYVIADPYGEPFPANTARTKWNYRDIRKPYKLSYRSFDIVNANGFNYYKKEHWCHLCSKM